MSPLARSLLALAVAALLHGACAAIKDTDAGCVNYEQGQEVGPVRDMEYVVIPRDTPVGYIDVDHVCDGNDPNGVQVWVCDDVPPTVSGFSPIVVTRNGDTSQRDAVASIRVWCPNHSNNS